jgi:NADH-quinone oxidoreductase subunit N
LDINDQLLHIRQSLGGILPEIFLGVFFCLFLLTELLVTRRFDNRRSAAWLQNTAILGSIVTLLLILGQWNSEPSFRFHPLLFSDRQAVFF